MAQEIIQEQIKALEAQLEAKKREAAATGEQKEPREMLKEVIRDIAQDKITTPVPPSTTSTPSDDQKKIVELKEKEHEPIVQELLDQAIGKDLFAAIKMAAALKNPHIEDEFHDKLAEYYDKLMASGKITP